MRRERHHVPLVRELALTRTLVQLCEPRVCVFVCVCVRGCEREREIVFLVWMC